MLKILILLAFLPASAAEITLDQSWFPKLGQLCQAAAYGARMLVEPICQELQQKADQAIKDEQAKKEKKEPGK